MYEPNIIQLGKLSSAEGPCVRQLMDAMATKVWHKEC